MPAALSAASALQVRRPPVSIPLQACAANEKRLFLSMFFHRTLRRRTKKAHSPALMHMRLLSVLNSGGA